MNQRHFKRSQFPSPICPCQFWIHKLWQPTPAGLSFWNELEMTASVGVQQGYLDMFCKITLPETNSKKKHLKIPGVLRSDEALWPSFLGAVRPPWVAVTHFFQSRGPGVGFGTVTILLGLRWDSPFFLLGYFMLPNGGVCQNGGTPKWMGL